jgi:N-acyl-D-glutamate deacylase
VADWYKSREGKAIVNYGLTVGHGSARVKLKNNREVGHDPTSPSGDAVYQLKEWKYEGATPEEIAHLVTLLDRGLNEGALGIGMLLGYTPGARRDEIFRVLQHAAERRVPIFVHVRSSGEAEPGSSVEAVQEVIANAATTGASTSFTSPRAVAGKLLSVWR